MEIIVQRKVEVWVEDIYEIKDLSQVQDAINYDIDCKCSYTLWETLVDLGPVEVYNKNRKLICKRDE